MNGGVGMFAMNGWKNTTAITHGSDGHEQNELWPRGQLFGTSYCVQQKCFVVFLYCYDFIVEKTSIFKRWKIDVWGTNKKNLDVVILDTKIIYRL